MASAPDDDEADDGPDDVDAAAEAPARQDSEDTQDPTGEAERVEAAGPSELPEQAELFDREAPSERAEEEAPPRAHVLAFAAGRGGTGRSLLAANVAVYLAQTGKKVVAIDADPAGGSLHLLLGTPRPPRGFGEFLRARVEGLTELMVDTP